MAEDTLHSNSHFHPPSQSLQDERMDYIDAMVDSFTNPPQTNFSAPLQDTELIQGVIPHLVTSPLPSPLPSLPNSDSQVESLPNISTAVPYQLSGASVINDVYKMHADLAANQGNPQDVAGEVSSLQRSRSETNLLSHRRKEALEHDPLLENVGKPGGMRRYFVGQRERERDQTIGEEQDIVPISYATTKRTRNFLEFLAIRNRISYERFAGEALSDTDDEDSVDDADLRWDEMIANEGGARFTTATERTPLRRHSKRLSTNPADDTAIVEKVSTQKTIFLLFKAFIGTGILFLPKAFSNGGFIFSTIVLFIVAFVAFYAIMLLAQCREVVPGGFGDIGGALYGPWMRGIVLAAIALSQFGFFCGATIFIGENVRQCLLFLLDPQNLPSTGFVLIVTTIVTIPLVLIRKMAHFSVPALVSDILIVACLLGLILFDIYHITSEGHVGPGIHWTINWADYAVFIGTAVYSFEGIGLVIPIRDSMQHPNEFGFALGFVMALVALLLTVVGGLGYAAFGREVRTVALLNLPVGPVAAIIQASYTIAILLSNPLALFPAVRILEQAIFGARTGKYNPKIKWQKNTLRVLVCGAAVLVAWAGASDLDRFISLIGSFCCAPLCFIFPALFHYGAVGKYGTAEQRVTDWVLGVMGMGVMLFTVSMTVKEWGT